MFCSECGGFMLPKNSKLVCSRCGRVEEIKDKSSFKRVERGVRRKKVLVLEDSDISTLPVTRAECPACKNMEAYWWLVQTRRADEPETRFLRCRKCGYTWREYD